MESDGNELASESTLRVLTSTMGTVNTTPNAITDSRADSLPSSSSDANHAEAEINADSKPGEDPISSTSDEVDRVAVSITTGDTDTVAAIIDKDETVHDIDKETDQFANEYNLATISADKITENVEDIVSDLENLLGDTSNNFKLVIPLSANISKQVNDEKLTEKGVVEGESVDVSIRTDTELKVEVPFEEEIAVIHPTEPQIETIQAEDEETPLETDPELSIEGSFPNEESSIVNTKIIMPLIEPVEVEETSVVDEKTKDNREESTEDLQPEIQEGKIDEVNSTPPEVQESLNESVDSELMDLTPTPEVSIITEHSFTIPKTLRQEIPYENVPDIVTQTEEMPITPPHDAIIREELEEHAPKQSKIETSMHEGDLETTVHEEENEKSPEPETSDIQEQEIQSEGAVEIQEQEQHSDVQEVLDPEAVLVLAALEASSIVNEGSKLDDKQIELNEPPISDEDVIRAAMDCTARNDEEDLIKAAQECEEREQHDDDDDDYRESSITNEILIEIPIPSPPALLTEIVEPSVSPSSSVDTEIVRLKELQHQNTGQDYQKPLNIVVDQPVVSVVKEAESTTNEGNELGKESSDEDKQEEYSSKISQSQELKLTIRKTKAEESSILKIYDPKNPMPEISPSESETDPENECPLPKLVIKQSQCSPKVMSPIKITFKSMPAVKPEEQSQQKSSPKVIIKPIVKPEEELHHSPKITIKPIPKPEELERCNSPKITIKPIIKPASESISPKIKIKPIPKPDEELAHEEERIVLKISKTRDATPKCEETEKLGKIKLKFSMDGGRAHIVSEDDSKPSDTEHVIDAKRPKLDISMDSSTSFQDSLTTETEPSPEVPPIPTPKKRGRPRKVPLQVRLEDEEPVVMEQPEPEPTNVSTRPKRSCRGPSVRDTLGMKPRKPRERGRGRGGGRGRIPRALSRKEKLVESKLKLIKEAAITAQINASFEYQRVEMKIDVDEDYISKEEQPDQSHEEVTVIKEVKPDVDMFEEDTRMSADTCSRAQTPAKQIINPIVTDTIEESQSSVQSSATTESVKAKKTKMEIEPEGAVISADQLAEYYWGGGGGPYMLQEQVAQYLGIKSFKRKYPGIPRRQVDMQERDFIRESGLASEHMCDLGLTAVNSSDILDLMYSDFQHKYEEYCKHQRDRQTKDITNKQKALSLAASQEKNKIDIMQQAVESAATWNANFNKTRREERKACMDLQTFTINYPKGKMKQHSRPKIGHYPIALVPGQYTDFYKTFTPTELNNLPLNTMLYNPINIPTEEDSQSDGSGSDSDSSTSGSDSSDSDSSDDDCNICSPPPISGNKRVYT